MDPLRVFWPGSIWAKVTGVGPGVMHRGQSENLLQHLPSQGRPIKRPLPWSPATHVASVVRPSGRVARPHVLHLRQLLGAGPLRLLPHPRPPELHQARARPRLLAAPQEWTPGGGDGAGSSAVRAPARRRAVPRPSRAASRGARPPAARRGSRGLARLSAPLPPGRPHRCSPPSRPGPGAGGRRPGTETS